MPIDAALDAAREAGLDLVMVAPDNDPPVVKISDYGKQRFAEQKKKAEARKKQKSADLKEIKLRPNNITAQYAMAYTLFRNQRYQESKEYITKALRLNSNDADMLLLASRIAQKLGNSTEHAKYSMQAKSANPLVVATN